jgi:hypothetical protein
VIVTDKLASLGGNERASAQHYKLELTMQLGYALIEPEQLV